MLPNKACCLGLKECKETIQLSNTADLELRWGTGFCDYRICHLLDFMTVGPCPMHGYSHSPISHVFGKRSAALRISDNIQTQIVTPNTLLATFRLQNAVCGRFAAESGVRTPDAILPPQLPDFRTLAPLGARARDGYFQAIQTDTKREHVRIRPSFSPSLPLRLPHYPATSWNERKGRKEVWQAISLACMKRPDKYWVSRGSRSHVKDVG